MRSLEETSSIRSPATFLAWLACLVLGAGLLVLAACGGEYSKAVKRGDQYAAAGRWAEATAEYEKAIALEPDEPEAHIKLDRVKEQQAREHLQRARALEARGEIAAALSAVGEAARTAPRDTTIQRELARLSKAAVTRARKLMDEDKLEQAFELTSLVLELSPEHPRARALDRKLRAALAARALTRAEEFSERDLPGNALVELAAALVYQPRLHDARLEFGRIKLALEQELTFAVKLAPFTGDRTSAPLARALTEATLRQTLDDRLLVRVVPAGKDAGPVPWKRGIAVSGQFAGYAYQHDAHDQQRSCDYVCGTDYQPNPRRNELERQVSEAERSLASIDSDVSRAEKTVLEKEREVSEQQRNIDRAQQDLDQARQRYDQCMQRADASASNPCSSERNTVESETRDLERERDRMQWPRQHVDSARQDLARIHDRREQSLRDVERYRRELTDTPSTIAVDRICPFSYTVSVHDVAARVTMRLTLEHLTGTTGDDASSASSADQAGATGAAIVRDEPFQYAERQQDETFPAQQGRCTGIAAGDPLDLPSERELAGQLIGKVVRDVRAKIMASYDSYRQHQLTVARKYERAGMTDEAVEAYVGYVLTGLRDDKGVGEIGKFLRRARGFGKLDALWSL